MGCLPTWGGGVSTVQLFSQVNQQAGNICPCNKLQLQSYIFYHYPTSFPSKNNQLQSLMLVQPKPLAGCVDQSSAHLFFYFFFPLNNHAKNFFPIFFLAYTAKCSCVQFSTCQVISHRSPNQTCQYQDCFFLAVRFACVR